MTSAAFHDDEGVLEKKGFGPFTTRVVWRKFTGEIEVIESRRQRKHTTNEAERTWWAPRSRSWWIGVLFAIGSACFAAAALPLVADTLGRDLDNTTYFVGSIFFTAAALLQFLEVLGTTPSLLTDHRHKGRFHLLFQPHRIDWWATSIQLVGTVFFNLTTGRAAYRVLTSPESINHAVWRPDAIGSICFLVASWLAWAEVCHGSWAWRPQDISWWIVGLNMAGSIAFGVSAVASKVDASGNLRSVGLTNLGTFVGAIGFLVGGILLLPERTAAITPSAHPQTT